MRDVTKRSALYGFVGGIVAVLLGTVAPQPWGRVVLWSLLALQALRLTWMFLRRTTMYTSAAAAFFLALSCVSVAVGVATGRPFMTLFTTISTLPLLVVWLILQLIVAPRVHKDQAERLKARMRAAKLTLWDVALVRHMPDLRHSS